MIGQRTRRHSRCNWGVWCTQGMHHGVWTYILVLLFSLRLQVGCCCCCWWWWWLWCVLVSMCAWRLFSANRTRTSPNDERHMYVTDRRLDRKRPQDDKSRYQERRECPVRVVRAPAWGCRAPCDCEPAAADAVRASWRASRTTSACTRVLYAWGPWRAPWPCAVGVGVCGHTAHSFWSMKQPTPTLHGTK